MVSRQSNQNSNASLIFYDGVVSNMPLALIDNINLKCRLLHIVLLVTLRIKWFDWNIEAMLLGQPLKRLCLFQKDLLLNSMHTYKIESIQSYRVKTDLMQYAYPLLRDKSILIMSTADKVIGLKQITLQTVYILISITAYKVFVLKPISFETVCMFETADKLIVLKQICRDTVYIPIKLSA